MDPNKEIKKDEFALEISQCKNNIGMVHIKPCHVFPLSFDKKVLRNISLLAVLTEDKPLFDETMFYKRCLIMTFGVDEDPGTPEMKKFQYFGISLPPSNYFVQMLHNIISYLGNVSWINGFLCDEASQIEGTKFLCAGRGPVNRIERNIRMWGRRISLNHLLIAACEGKANPDVCVMLVSKGAKITAHIEKCLSGKPDLLLKLKEMDIS